MKNTIQILIFFLCVSHCKSQDFKTNYETIEINIPGRPGPWLKHNGQFYCYFITDNDKFSSGSTHHFYILDEKGNLKSKITVPKKLQTFHYDLYVKNDSIFTTEYYNKDTFFLDEKNKNWIETKKGIDLFYEDKNYAVYSLDFGEWGGVTWFKDTKTNKQYEVAASNPIINKLENVYYITEANKILKIMDPQKLEISKEPYDYKKAVLNEKYFRNGSNSLKGSEVIYEYTDDDYFNPKFSLATSFIANNKLYTIYTDSISTKIGSIENKQLIPLYNFKKAIKPFQFYYDWRNPIQNNKYQTNQFSTNNEDEYGIIEINDGNLTVTAFKNSSKETEFGEAKIKEWFQKTFDFYYANLDKLHLKEIDSIEQKEKATDLTQSHKISHYLLDEKDVETPRIYRKIESPSLRLNTSYYYTTKEKSVQLIEFEWGKNKTQINNTEDMIAGLINNDKSESLYKTKFDWISKFLTIKLGKSNSNKKDKKSATQEWKKENKIIELHYDEYLLELTIYKK